MTSRLCGIGGSFFIGSGEAGLLLEEHQYEYRCNYQGTALRLRLRPSDIGSITERLRQFRTEGQELARETRGAVITASVASHMLSRDFPREPTEGS